MRIKRIMPVLSAVRKAVERSLKFQNRIQRELSIEDLVSAISHIVPHLLTVNVCAKCLCSKRQTQRLLPQELISERNILQHSQIRRPNGLCQYLDIHEERNKLWMQAPRFSPLWLLRRSTLWSCLLLIEGLLLISSPMNLFIPIFNLELTSFLRLLNASARICAM